MLDIYDSTFYDVLEEQKRLRTEPKRNRNDRTNVDDSFVTEMAEKIEKQRVSDKSDKTIVDD